MCGCLFRFLKHVNCAEIDILLLFLSALKYQQILYLAFCILWATYFGFITHVTMTITDLGLHSHFFRLTTNGFVQGASLNHMHYYLYMTSQIHMLL